MSGWFMSDLTKDIELANKVAEKLVIYFQTLFSKSLDEIYKECTEGGVELPDVSYVIGSSLCEVFYHSLGYDKNANELSFDVLGSYLLTAFTQGYSEKLKVFTNADKPTIN
jgi:hypothetical protein